MKPEIDTTEFGYITVAGRRIDHDVVIRLSGEVEKRKKKLSKAVYGTSHTVSLAEAKYVYERGAQRLIVGTGQNGMVRLSDEAADFFAAKNLQVSLEPTPEAVSRWNRAKGAVIGLFHVTC
jgi:hypothetical protein